MKEPKRWQCIECDHTSNRFAKVKTESFDIAACKNCGGIIKESDEWLYWHEKQTERQLKLIKDNGGYFMGEKIF